MSFDMKYDRDGNVITPAPAPVVDTVSATETAVPTVDQMETLEATDEEQDSVQAQPENEDQVLEEVKPVKTKVSSAESFKQLKEAKEREANERYRAERERDDLARKYRELEAKMQKPETKETPDEDYSININPDDLVEGKHLSKVDKKIQALEKQLKQYEQQTTINTIQSRLKIQFPDFDSVVSPSNIESLKNNYPELAQTLNSSTDLYATAVSAYTMMKKLGIAQSPEQKADIERVQRNAAKPRPLASVSPQQGDSPLSKANAFANGLTDELKEQLRKEMFTARSNM
jgi:hypothetical protein